MRPGQGILAFTVAAGMATAIGAASAGAARAQDDQGGAARAAQPGSDPVAGVFLSTPYPVLTIEAGRPTTIPVELSNRGRPPVRLDLAVEGAPEGWTVRLSGDGHPVAAAIVGVDQTRDLDLRIEPKGEPGGKAQELTLVATGDGLSRRLPIDVSLAKALPPQLSLQAEYPELKGPVSQSFDYDMTIRNDGGREVQVTLAPEVPEGFHATVKKRYGSQELTTIPVDAGKSQQIKLEVRAPAGTPAGRYPVKLTAAADGIEATEDLSAILTGEPKLALSTSDGRVSGQAYAGDTASYSLVVANTGSAPAEKVTLSASAPGNWKTSFQPETIPAIAPGDAVEVSARVTPPERAIAGDYMATFRLRGDGGSDTLNYRVTVLTSTVWGAVAVGVIAVALLVVVGAVIRFGRR